MQTHIQVTIDMQGKRLGVEVEPAFDGNALLVKGIQPDGAVAFYNLSNPSKVVSPNDHILAINNVQGAAKMIGEVQAGRPWLVLTIEKGKEQENLLLLPGKDTYSTMKSGAATNRIQVHLDMGLGLKLGLDMDWATDPRCIFIRDIKPDGAVAHWNKSNPPGMTVMAGDRIVGVNHVEGDAKAMINEGTTCFKAKARITLNVENNRPQNLIIPPGPAAAPPSRGFKRPAPEGGDEIDKFCAQWGLPKDAEGFLRQQKPPIQEEILNTFFAEEGHRDPITKFFSWSKRIINAGQPHSYGSRR